MGEISNWVDTEIEIKIKMNYKKIKNSQGFSFFHILTEDPR